MPDVMKELETFVDTYDADFKCNVGSGAAWAGQLRVTLSDPSGAPSRSMTFYTAGQGSSRAVVRAVLDDCREWMAETGVIPLPVPAWLRE